MRAEHGGTVRPVDVSTWINLGLLALTLVGTIVTLAKAGGARKDRKDAKESADRAAAARDESLALARQANSAFDRQARALERANELAESGLAKPKPNVSWAVQQVSKSRYMVTNTGDAIARNALVEAISGLVIPEEGEPRDVMPGDSMFFNAMRTLGGDVPRAQISCDVDGEPERAENKITLP